MENNMGIISFGENIKEKPKDALVTKPEPTEKIITQFFGIVNTGNKSNVLVGPFDSSDKALSKLAEAVETLMADPMTELIPGEDTAVVYEKIDDELFVVQTIDIYAMLEEGEDDE